MTLEERVKFQLGELLWVNLNLGQQLDDAKAELEKAKAEIPTEENLRTEE